MHPLGPPPGPAQLPPQASLPGEGGGAAAILPGRGRGTSRVPYEREPRAAARTPKEGGGGGASARVLPPAGSLRPAGWAAGASALRPPQEDAAGRRRALREQLQRGLRERTGRLRALGAR